eukprot:scaffold53954_cov63-Cyclotella_meneghiniana.AAC.2
MAARMIAVASACWTISETSAGISVTSPSQLQRLRVQRRGSTTATIRSKPTIIIGSVGQHFTESQHLSLHTPISKHVSIQYRVYIS